MAEKNPKAPTVEVRLLSKRFRHYVNGVEVERRQGDVFHIDRAAFEADIEPDRGMGRPAYNRTFQSLAADKAVEQRKMAVQEATQKRIDGVRESMREQLQASDDARVRAKAMEAENLRAAAEALKPLERPGARRVA